MQLDDELCLCFHVTRRKVVNYLRIERPRAAAQLADCYGAGTGCGWCRPFLKRMFDAAQHHESQTGADGPVASATSDPTNPDADDLPAAADYAAARSRYVRAGKGTPPPGATPIEDGPIEGGPIEGAS